MRAVLDLAEPDQLGPVPSDGPRTLGPGVARPIELPTRGAHQLLRGAALGRPALHELPHVFDRAAPQLPPLSDGRNALGIHDLLVGDVDVGIAALAEGLLATRGRVLQAEAAQTLRGGAAAAAAAAAGPAATPAAAPAALHLLNRC
eukprot:7072772-Alexandrium_andersonii.AAC.1